MSTISTLNVSNLRDPLNVKMSYAKWKITVIGSISLKLNFLCNYVRACAILRVRVMFSCPATSMLFSHFINKQNINLNGLRVPRPDSVRPGIADACQSCKMATLSNKLLYFMYRLILRVRLTNVSSIMIILDVVQCCSPIEIL